MIGSAAVIFFDERGWDVHGLDNNMRKSFFGPDGDTAWNLERIKQRARHYSHHDVDIRDRETIHQITKTVRPDLIVHCAAQPSHDLAKDRPFDDFDINAGGTLNLLEAARQYTPESPFIFMSTNKVYGDAPNEIPLVELGTRFDYAESRQYDGIDESCRIDRSLHSLFGVSKVAADIMVQEYGRYFNMPTVCFRGGCMTGPYHSGAQLHGYLAYMTKAVLEGRTYTIFGYKGKQVRDNIHAFDVCDAILRFHENPRAAAVYNLGGGRDNSISVLEAIEMLREKTGREPQTEYSEQNRLGDHICYISNMTRFKTDFPEWEISRDIDSIMDELVAAVSARNKWSRIPLQGESRRR